MTKLCFMDTETTGLSRQYHEVWEIAIVIAEHNPDGLFIESEHEWWIKPQQLHLADPMALKINGFYERTKDESFKDEQLFSNNSKWDDPATTALEIARLTQGTHLVGAVPDFDAFFVTSFLTEHGHVPGWHYHLIDVETLIAGRFGLVPPYKSEDLFELLGLSRAYPGKHTAFGDVKQLIATWNALYFKS